MKIQRAGFLLIYFLAVLWQLAAAGRAEATIDGLAGPNFNLVAGSAHISTPDGDSLLVWGYGPEGAVTQYPGPTLIVNQGETVTVTLRNTLTTPVSMVFPGQGDVGATGGLPGLLTREAPPDGVTTVTYRFVAERPGTFIYYSGTRPELQVEMGLVGAIIVRPIAPKQAYDHPATAFDQEYLFLLTEMDPQIHYLVEWNRMAELDTTLYHPVLWFINGRNAPDTMAPARANWMPNQPYNCLPRTHPGERVLMRLVGASRDAHPFHTHGNNMRQIARDGWMLESSAGAGPDLALSDYTLTIHPGATYDALFTWTGEGLGWDIYGHAAGDLLAPNESAADHGKPFPVTLPDPQDLTFGGFYSGSPFLGTLANLPPGQGGLNMNGGLFFMWHSHTERELVNNDIFPGGMMTMVIIEPPGVPID